MPPAALHAPLPDGRVVDLVELGDPDGRPVLALHGTPASAAVWEPLDAAARRAGVRLVAPNRPGIAGSTRRPDYTVREAAEDAVAAARSLGVERFSVLGWSGGCPYALGCAAVAPGEVDAVVLLGAVAPPGAPVERLNLVDLSMEWLSVHAPAVAGAALGVQATLARLAPGVARQVLEVDLRDPDRVAVRSAPQWWDLRFFTDAFRTGAVGVVEDYRAAARPWGFALEDVTAPTTVFWGDHDSITPRSHSEHVAAAVGTEVEVLPGRGHFAVVTEADRLLAATSPAPPA